MKHLIRSVKAWFGRHSMRTKLAVSFSATIVLIFMLVMVLLNYFITSSYREKFLHSAEQSYDQAYSFLENYLDTMLYVSDLIYYNGDLQRVMSSERFHGDRSFGEQYREFLEMNKVFTSVEMAETIYQARVYIPDDIFYSANMRHFIGNSKLQERPDYARFLEVSKKEKVYFTAPEYVEIPGLNEPVNLVSLLRTIRRTDGSAIPIGVEQVSIETSELEKVLQKSDITSSGLVYLVNEAGELISTSGGGSQMLRELAQTGGLPGAGDSSWSQQMLGGEQYLVNRKSLRNADWGLVALIPEREIAQQSRQAGSIIALLTLPAVAAVVTLSILISRYYTRRLNRLADMMALVQAGNLEVDFGEQTEDEIGELFRSFSYMKEELKNLLDEKYRSGKAVKSAQFRALQAQINPHFLYNTLDLINWEAMDHDAPEIAEIAQSLAEFYRISLNKGREIVTVGEELNHVRAYVRIENYHFDGAINLKIEVPEEVLGLGCINIILQPFVENSIMHGIAEDPSILECNIRIRAWLEGGDLVFAIADDGLGMTEKQLEEMFSSNPSRSHGYGVKNINSRIRLCYGEDYGLTYSSRIGLGTTVEMRIPALTPEEAEQRVQ